RAAIMGIAIMGIQWGSPFIRGTQTIEVAEMKWRTRKDSNLRPLPSEGSSAQLSRLILSDVYIQRPNTLSTASASAVAAGVHGAREALCPHNLAIPSLANAEQDRSGTVMAPWSSK